MDEAMKQMVEWGVIRSPLPLPQREVTGLDVEDIEAVLVEWQDRERFARTNGAAAWPPAYCQRVIAAARLTITRAVTFGFEPSV